MNEIKEKRRIQVMSAKKRLLEKKGLRKKGRGKERKEERHARVEFNISVAFLQSGSLGVHADYREDDLETL